jgi:hypothetical protein
MTLTSGNVVTGALAGRVSGATRLVEAVGMPDGNGISSYRGFDCTIGPIGSAVMRYAWDTKRRSLGVWPVNGNRNQLRQWTRA